MDGKGGRYSGVVIETSKNYLIADIRTWPEEITPKTFHLHIAIAPTKNIDRFEWFLEKATELGIDEITPLQCEHSERNKIRMDRLEKILIAAMKQSLRSRLPKLNALTSFQTFISQNKKDPTIEGFIAHCSRDTLPHLMNCCRQGNDTTILIGPEGDFSQKEILMAEEAGFKGISLGKARLRTETAGIAACHIVNLLNE